MQILWFLPDCSADLCSDPWPPFSLLSAGIFQLPTPLSSRWLYSNSLAAFHALISVTFTLLPASSVLAAFTDPPLAFWSAASILLLFRWGDPRVLMLTGDRLRREPPPRLFIRASLRTTWLHAPCVSECHRTVVVKLSPYEVISFELMIFMRVQRC